MDRIVESDATATLIAAMDKAERMEHVIILYQTKKEFAARPGGYNVGVMSTEGTEVATANWLADIYKQWLMSRNEEQ